MDADNELTHPDYIELAVRALARNPQALGVEGTIAVTQNEFLLCLFDGLAAHQRPDLLADELQSRSGGTGR